MGEALREKIVANTLGVLRENFTMGSPQIEIIAEMIGRMAVQAVKEAGWVFWNRGNLQRLLFQCGLSGEQVSKVMEAINSQIGEVK